MILAQGMIKDKVTLADRALAREITQLLNSLKENHLSEEQRQQIRNQLKERLDELADHLQLGDNTHI